MEGLLKLMLRGEDADIKKMVIGDLRKLLIQLHEADKAPWDRPVFNGLLAAIDKTRSQMKYIEGAHHTTGRNYGMVEATDVEQHWRKNLCPALDRAFRAVREYRLLHGDMKALYALPPTTCLPESYQAKVRNIPLNILGRAAALTDGRAADGFIEMEEFTAGNQMPIKLHNHSAYRLVARTLEPVARPGDILLTKQRGEPSPKSLVVALSEDRLLARRFELAENHSDVAILTAQAINPREIAAPIVSHRSTLVLYKIIGVLFGHGGIPMARQDDHEVCDCGGEAALSYLTAGTLGLVKVTGHSAEPLVLHEQYLIVKRPISANEALRLLDGKPVIAEDNDRNYFFKRLRSQGAEHVFLESLDISGDYSPIVLRAPGQSENSLKQVWPVAGVLFELPT